MLFALMEAPPVSLTCYYL